MFLYNITSKVDNLIAKTWLQWQKEIHIPAILETGLFYSHYMYELLEQDDNEGRTFVTQFLATTKEEYEKYMALHAQHFSEESIKRWGNQSIAFRTLLKKIN